MTEQKLTPTEVQVLKSLNADNPCLSKCPKSIPEDIKQTPQFQHLVKQVEKRTIEDVERDDRDYECKINTLEEIKQRKYQQFFNLQRFFKAQRSNIPGPLSDEKTQDNSEIKSEQRGKFVLSGAVGGNFDLKKDIPSTLTFNFTLNANQTKEQREKVIKDDEGRRMSKPFKMMKLNDDEKKTVVNKNLFENSVIKAQQFDLPKISTVGQRNDQESQLVNNQEKKYSLVDSNPLNSYAAIKMQNIENEKPVATSLFDFKENEQYKSTTFPPKVQEKKVGFRPAFTAPNFNNISNPFLQKPAQAKPFEATNQNSSTQIGTNPFLNASGQSLFAPQKPIFQANDDDPFGLRKPRPQNSEQNINQEHEQEDPLEPDVKEKVISNDQFEKVFQKQVLRIKILKGVSQEEKQVSKKDQGFLSIEKMNRKEGEAPVHLVFRNFTGSTLFSGLINKSIAKIKEINDQNKPNAFKAKVAVLCREFKDKTFQVEHVEIKFNTNLDRQLFIEVFQQYCK